MKKIALGVCLLVLLAVFFLGSVAKAEDKDVSFLAYTEILSQYVSSNGPAVALNKPIWVTGLCVSFQNGTFVYLTNTSDLKWEETYGNEVDVQGGWAGKVGPLELLVMTEYFDMIPLSESSGDIIQYRAALGKTFALNKENFLRPYIVGKVQFPIDTGDGREIYFFGLEHKWKPEKFALSQTAQIFHNTSTDGIIGDYSADISVGLWKNLSVYGKFRVVSSLYETKACKDALFISGGGLKFAF